MKWFEHHVNLTRMARHLVENEGFDAEELLGFLEKPWKWDVEWKSLENGTSPFVAGLVEVDKAAKSSRRDDGKLDLAAFVNKLLAGPKWQRPVASHPKFVAKPDPDDQVEHEERFDGGMI